LHNGDGLIGGVEFSGLAVFYLFGQCSNRENTANVFLEMLKNGEKNELS
jgi:hypothetical protein